MKLSIATLLILAIVFLDGTMMMGASAKPGGDGDETTTPSGAGQAVTGGFRPKSKLLCARRCKGKPDAEGGKFCGEYINKRGGKIYQLFRSQCELDCVGTYKKSADNRCMRSYREKHGLTRETSPPYWSETKATTPNSN